MPLVFSGDNKKKAKILSRENLAKASLDETATRSRSLNPDLFPAFFFVCLLWKKRRKNGKYNNKVKEGTKRSVPIPTDTFKVSIGMLPNSLGFILFKKKKKKKKIQLTRLISNFPLNAKSCKGSHSGDLNR